MTNNLKTRIICGGIIWIVLTATSLFGIGKWVSTDHLATRQLTHYLTRSRQTVELEFDQLYAVRIGDPIMYDDGIQPRMVGAIRHVGGPDSIDPKLQLADRAYAELFAGAPEGLAGATLSYHSTPDSMMWVIQTMLPQHTRDRIADLIVDAFSEHQQEIVDELQPILVKTIQDAADVIREDFQVSVQNRQQQLQKLGNKYQAELVEKQLAPLVKKEVWPIIQRETGPLAEEIGLQLWNEASLWRFGWRMVYDQLPLTDRNLTQREFERFLQYHAKPVIESRFPDIVRILQRVVVQISRNSNVRETVVNSAQTVIYDEEFQQLVYDLFRDVMTDNPRLQAVLKENWNSPEAQQALAMTNQRLQPTITRIGQTLFGSPDTRITPEFSRVLRNKIMQKDDRWFVLHVGDQNASIRSPVRQLPVTKGSDSDSDPFYAPARARN